MTFDIEDFLAPLDPPALLLMFGIGTLLGFLTLRLGYRLGVSHLAWQTAGAVCFFVPLAIFRGASGVDTWERILGTGAAFVVFCLGMYVGGRAR